ncbi:MAG: hypothetical protein JSW67_02760 [Candidatus Latescibacterota bacterium]|nr:MAG: hypothetical protein JSW67_02760 [Candidatus Latescibacterota bacterium]
MTVEVSLARVVMEMDVPGEDWTPYLNRRTGEFATLADDDVRAFEDGRDPEYMDSAEIRQVLESNDWLTLPTRFDIHEYSIMESFCQTVESEQEREELFVAIRGRGAFRMFKHWVHRLGIQDDWYRFREQAFEEIAVEWLEQHDIQYSRTPISADNS